VLKMPGARLSNAHEEDVHPEFHGKNGTYTYHLSIFRPLTFNLPTVNFQSAGL